MSNTYPEPDEDMPEKPIAMDAEVVEKGGGGGDVKVVQPPKED